MYTARSTINLCMYHMATWNHNKKVSKLLNNLFSGKINASYCLDLTEVPSDVKKEIFSLYSYMYVIQLLIKEDLFLECASFITD